MKYQVNMTTAWDDVNRFQTREEIVEFIKDFDGIEFMHYGDDEKITPDMVTGLHARFRETWIDFWLQDEERLIQEFDNLETVEHYYGSLDPQSLVNRVKEDLSIAHRYGAEYIVFHVSDCTITEALTFKYKHSSEEVIDAVCDILNQAFEDEDGSIALLMENLWYPGLNLTEPEMTRRLLDGVKYSNKGIMFDTGHLLHTNFDLRSQEEGLAYINKRLDEQEEFLEYFRGMHLQQSITGDFCKQLMENPIEFAPTYAERSMQIFTNIFKIDQHRPFTAPGVADMIRRLPLEYLTFEFITANSEEHAEFLAQQWAALGGGRL